MEDEAKTKERLIGELAELRQRITQLEALETRHKQTEEALGKSERVYEELLVVSSDMIFAVDTKGNFLFTNKAFGKHLGYSDKEMKKLNGFALVHPDDLEAVLEQFALLLEGKSADNMEYRYKTKDGSYINIITNASPILGAQGDVVAAMGIARDATERRRMEDKLRIYREHLEELVNERTVELKRINEQLRKEITERKHIEEALKKSHERFRALIENSSDIIQVVDSGGIIRYISPSAQRILGYKPEELVGRPSIEVVHPDDLPEVAKGFEKAIKEPDVPVVTVCRCKHKDGTWRVIEGSGTNCLDNPSINGFIANMHDITERKQAEEALRDSESKFRGIVEQSYDGIILTDEQGTIIEWNQSEEQITGVKRADAVGRPFWDVMAGLAPGEVATPELFEQAKVRFSELLKTGRASWLSRVQEATIQRTDGTRCVVEELVFPIKKDKGLVIGAICRDVTEQKEAETERRELEQKAQLASRLATVGEMASGISHEINNPLTGVIGYAQLLMQRQDIPEEAKKDLKVINDGGQRVAGIVNKMLTFARQHKPQRDYVSINDLIANTLDLRAYELKTHNIELITHLDPELPATIADGGQLQQVFLNLIINAETEMDLAHGKGKLSIKTEKIDDTIRISFKDDGSGIAKENMDKIFNPFFTTREVGEGTGLGLSMCHGIIAEHNGRIYAESKLGKGATFVVELPIVTKPEQLELAEPEVEEAEEAAQARILVVDDEPTVLSLVSRVLTGEGHEVETIDNADDALEMIESKRYRLILLDIKMPGMSGTELYKRIHKIAPSLARRIVFITGDVIGARITAFLSSTKAHYIMKPFDAEQLKRAVNRILTA